MNQDHALLIWKYLGEDARAEKPEWMLPWHWVSIMSSKNEEEREEFRKECLTVVKAINREERRKKKEERSSSSSALRILD